MGRIEDVCTVLGKACMASVVNANVTVPAQFYVGSPFGPSLTKILTQAQYAVTVMPMQAGRRITPRTIQHVTTSIVQSPLLCEVTQTGLLFSGSCIADLNINIIATCRNIGVKIISYTTTSNDTLDSLASHAALAFQGLGGPVTGASSGAAVNVTGVVALQCNVGSTGTVTQETSRFEQRIKVSTWTPTAYKNTGDPINDPNKGLRAAVTDAIINAVGTESNMWYDMGDGTSARFRLTALPFYVDDSQSDYNLYESHIVYLAEYSLVSVTPVTQVGVVELDIVLPTGNLTFIGG